MTVNGKSTVVSRKPRLDREIDRLRPLAGFDFLAVGGLDTRDFEAAVGADDGEAVGFNGDDFAELAGDSFRIFGRQRLGVEDLERLAVEQRPGAWRRIAAADQPIDLLPGLAPVDLGVVGPATALVSGL